MSRPARLAAVPLASNQTPGYVRLASLTFIGCLFTLRLALLPRHAFNPDEFQHLHGAWCIAHGLLPYRDYFEHHTPWLPFFLAPFLGLFPVETNPEAARAFIFFARGLMAIFSGLALVLTYRLGRLWKDSVIAWTGTALLSAVVIFLDLTLEVRPDVPAVAFVLGSWVAWLLALRTDAERESRLFVFRSGLLLGAAILCTQKILFTLPATAFLWAVIMGKQGADRKQRGVLLLLHVLGTVLPISVMLTVFALQGGLRAFVDFNLLVNLNWPARFSPAPLLRQLFGDNTLIALLGLVGLGTGIWRFFRPDGRRLHAALVPVQALGLAVGLFVIPIPYAQYLLPLLPLLALLSADVLVNLVRAIRRLRQRSGRRAILALAAVLTVISFVPPFRIMASMLVPPQDKVGAYFHRLRYVTLNSRSTDRFLDGFSGVGVFRPHAYFYFFLHDEIRLLLQGQGLNRLYAELRDGWNGPDWVVLDDDLQALPSRIVTFLETNYEPAEVLPMWRLKGPWLDDSGWRGLGDGEAERLAGRGWSPSQREGGRSFRQGSARHSSIRVPIRDPGGCREILLRARSGSPASEFLVVRVLLNRRSLGVTALGKDWKDHRLPLPEGLLRPGVNSLELNVDGALPGVPPGPTAPSSDSPLEVEALRLECGREQGSFAPPAVSSR